MLNTKYVVLALGFAAAIASGPIWAAEPASKAELKIDVPVQLKASKIVFNMDRLSFAGDQSVGLTHMTLVLQSYRANNAPLQIIALSFMARPDTSCSTMPRTTRCGGPRRASRSRTRSSPCKKMASNSRSVPRPRKQAAG